MSSSLLSLPDELLEHIVDEALGEYEPRLYKQRQDTARSLCLVNRRIGVVAQGKIVEAAQLGRFHEQHPVKALQRLPDAVTRQVRHYLDLRKLVLSDTYLSSSTPLVAPHLVDLSLQDCHFVHSAAAPTPFLNTTACPRLRYLTLAELEDNCAPLFAPELFGQVHCLYFNLSTCTRQEHWEVDRWRDLNLSTSSLEKALFGLSFSELADTPHVIREVKHAHIFQNVDLNDCIDSDDEDEEGPCWPYYTFQGVLASVEELFPELQTLYLASALDPTGASRGRATTVTLGGRQVVVVFEASDYTGDTFDNRASPHFEARCRRLQREQACA
ncbi:hypothetical protein JCM10449v2_003760 [Rhodotorula kratochvilovae]